jgi:DNA-binding XRE family transcriptional regulator
MSNKKVDSFTKREKMKPPMNIQFIEQDGDPAFVVIPYIEYLKLVSVAGKDEDALIPHEVLELSIKKDCNLISAWRIHLSLTQKEVAKRAGISQSALSQIERAENTRSATLEKMADAMGLAVSQLTD